LPWIATVKVSPPGAVVTSRITVTHELASFDMSMPVTVAVREAEARMVPLRLMFWASAQAANAVSRMASSRRFIRSVLSMGFAADRLNLSVVGEDLFNGAIGQHVVFRYGDDLDPGAAVSLSRTCAARHAERQA
jgi:hypothetical protein